MAMLLMGIKKLSYPFTNKASTKQVPNASIADGAMAWEKVKLPTRIILKEEQAKAEAKKAPDPIKVFVEPKTLYLPIGNRFPIKAAKGSEMERISRGK